MAIFQIEKKKKAVMTIFQIKKKRRKKNPQTHGVRTLPLHPPEYAGA